MTEGRYSGRPEGVPLHAGRSADLKGLYESSRAVTTVDGLPPASSHFFFTFRMLLWPTCRSIFLRNCAVVHKKLLYLLSRFLRFSQNVLVAPVALRIPCLQKSIEIVNVLKTNRKPLILHHFFERILCDRLRFFLSRLGAFASRS